MVLTIFDTIEKEEPKGQKGFFEAAKSHELPPDDSMLGKIKDYGKTVLKGTAEGLTRLGRMMGPLDEGKPNQQLYEEQTEKLNELLPTDEGYVQSSLRRGLREAPSMMAFPGSTLGTLPRSIASGFAGEGAKELGAPEWVQTAAELTAYMGPDLTKKLIESGNNKKIIQEARSLGLTDEAITPLLQSDFKTKWLSKLSPKRGATEKALSTSKAQLSESYNIIQKSPDAGKPLSQLALNDLMSDFAHKLYNMPAGVRNKVKEDFRNLISAPITGETLINFYKDVNHYLGPNTKQLSLLKEPIRNALYSISPQMGKDFQTINDLFSRYYKISSKLKPTLTSDLVSAAENIGLLGSLVTGQIPIATGILGEKSLKKIAQQMLINPRFQQIAEKTVKAMNQNKYGMVKKLADLYAYELEKIDEQEAASVLKSLTEDQLKEFLNQK